MEHKEILQKLKNDDRDEETRIEDMTEALTWLSSQLVSIIFRLLTELI